ncbi:conjugal transfer protein TrbL family protein [Catellatospora chokoriensis]|uniref:conjugal transfer protein TrbL family protein n=1 Tax=Catellatospora chokoriensis TaxID=310353 RepID=UPI0017823FEA|nr:conjugal transfer protein TrbL family protein [Catellatospora chokoriensis]
MVGYIVGWLATNVDNALNLLWDLLSSSLLRSPDVTALPQVEEFAGTSLTIVNAAYVLAVLVVGFMVMGRGTISSQSPYGAGELIPRLIIGWVGANFALPVCSLIIRFANSLTEAMTKQPIQSPESLGYLRQLVKSALLETPVGTIPGAGTASPNAFLLILIGLIIAVLLGLLLCQLIVRLGTLVFLAGVAPVALALHGLPWTEAGAKLWWRAMLGTVGTVFAQAVMLHVAMRILLTPSANLPVLGLPGDPGATMNLLIVVCILLGVVKIPALMKRYVLRSGSGSGRVIGFLILQQATRVVTGRLPGLGRRTVAAGAGRRVGPDTAGGWPRVPQQPPSEPTRPGRPPWRGRASTSPDPAGSRAVGPGRSGYRPPARAPRPATPLRPYTAQELADGVDLYTRRVKKPPL